MAGQTDPHISLFSPQEVEFMAEDEMVEIVPNMNMDPLNFIAGDYGRFVPQIPTQVPLWLAVALKRRGKCTFRPPAWLSVDNLTQVLEAEREPQSKFQPLPSGYIEIARLLFDHARDDIPDMYMVKFHLVLLFLVLSIFAMEPILFHFNKYKATPNVESRACTKAVNMLIIKDTNQLMLY